MKPKMEQTLKEKYSSKRPPERARQPEETDEEYARYVMGWMAENKDFIIKSVEKNTTYDEELWEDVFTDSLVLIYDNLIKHPKHLDSVCDWVFLCVKTNYITAQKKKRKQEQLRVMDFNFGGIDDDTDWKEREDFLNQTNSFIEYLCGQLEEEMGSVVSNTWIIYYRLKSEKPSSISYAKLSKILNISPNVVSQRIQSCKKWFTDNEEIIRRKYNNCINN